MNSPDHIRTPTGHLMVLREGADVFAALERLAVQEALPSASFTGYRISDWTMEIRWVESVSFRTRIPLR